MELRINHVRINRSRPVVGKDAVKSGSLREASGLQAPFLSPQNVTSHGERVLEWCVKSNCCIHRNFRKKINYQTKIHSSGMRTARALTISGPQTGGGGVNAEKIAIKKCKKKNLERAY